MLILLLILLPMIAAPALFALAGRNSAALRWGPMICAGLELALSALLMVFPGSAAVPGILLGGLHFDTGGFQNVYSLIASALWLGATLFSREYFLHEPEHLRSYWAFQFLTLGAVQGLFLSADFMTAFCFFELLSLCSFPWVMHTRTAGAIRAGCTYLAVSVIGGLILFFGLILLHGEAGTLTYAELPGALSGADPGRMTAAQVCMLLGFGAKAGMFPLHIWLPKAHPVAPAPASALLSGMLTKAGIYGILMMGLYVIRDGGFGRLVLVLGLITMAAGAVLALLSVDLKRTLACSSMSQIGFILTGLSAMLLCRAAGEAEAASVALNGALLHMVNHSLLKLALFLSAGAAAMNLHTLDLNDLRGWGRNKHLLKLVFLVAALGISGVPGFNGYLSKTLLHEGLTEAIHLTGLWAGTEWIFLISGGLTLAYMTKLFVCLFVEKNQDPVRQAAYDKSKRAAGPLSSAVLICADAALLPLGVPKAALALGSLMSGEEPLSVAFFGLVCLKGGGISLAVGASVYLLLVRTVLCRGGQYRNLLPGWLDLEDSVYRPLLLRGLPALLGPVARLFGENLLLTPLCRGLVWLGSVIGRALDTGFDGLILLLGSTLFRETAIRDRDSVRQNDRRSAPRRALVMALGNVVDNFSFAMMIACAGIVLVFLLMVLF